MMALKCVIIFLVISEHLDGAVHDTYGRSETSFNNNTIFRTKRDSCGDLSNMFRCRNDSCIKKEWTCDGSVDCPDGSDETHHLCRNNRCPDHQFRCTYGACVDGTVVCNGVADCADNSDELQPRCLNDLRIIGSQFKCDHGNLIELYMLCDGVKHCRDGSDETLRSCAGNTCPSNSFQCAYGACINEKAECDYINDCADGSDETDFLCSGKIPRTTTPKHILGKCILPFHLKNGHYLKNGLSPMYNPGDAMDTVFFNVTCQPGFKLDGARIIVCFNGYWSYKNPPSCLRACKIPDTPSVNHRCLVPGGSGITRDCEDLEAVGTIVKPECNPNYYSRTDPPYMECVDGVWSYEHKCHAECGILGPKGERGEFPWDAVIYKRHGNSYKRHCSATIISEMYLLSAAHCFWKNGVGKLTEDIFAIAVGKLHSEWNHPDDDKYTQKSHIKEIILADRFDGADQNYQYDLAVVIPHKRFQFQTYIRPACLDLSPLFNKYDNQYDNSQIDMADGTLGKVAAWWTGDRGSSIRKVVNMLYVTFDECKNRVPKEYVEFLMGDKFCAGFADGLTVCEGASGGGWVYPLTVGGVERYHLGGIVSTKPRTSDGSSNQDTLTSFTDIFMHAQLIGQYWRE